MTWGTTTPGGGITTPGSLTAADMATGAVGVTVAIGGTQAAIVGTDNGIVGDELRLERPNATALLATASIAWILAVAAAAATAAAVGIIEPVVGPKRALGGVIARPTLQSSKFSFPQDQV